MSPTVLSERDPYGRETGASFASSPAAGFGAATPPRRCRGAIGGWAGSPPPSRSLSTVDWLILVVTLGPCFGLLAWTWWTVVTL